LPVRCTRGAVDLDRLGVEIDDEIAGVDDRLGVALGAAHDRVDARDQLVLVERLGHVVVGAEAEPRTLSSMPARPERIRIGVFTFETRRRAQHLVARHVGRFRSSRMMS
jgi:hypothetical protein